MTRDLLEELDPTRTDAPLRLMEVGVRVQNRMARRTRNTQIPQVGHLEGSQGGDFIFYQPPEAQPIDLLPEDLRLGLSDENPLMRRFAIDAAEKLLADSQVGEAVRMVLEDMQYDDPDRAVRRKAGRALKGTRRPPPPPPVDPSQVVRDVIGGPFEWVDIPAGDVTLITEEGWTETYIPVGEKTFSVKAFQIGRYCVTNAQFDAFIREGYDDERWWRYSDAALNWHRENPQPEDKVFDGDEHPRVNVAWYEAVAFCLWLGERTGQRIMLPTEQQWQRAAQGDDGRTYAWGDDYIQGYANIDEKSSDVPGGVYLEKTTPVNSYPQQAQRQPYGLYNMTGNVFDWCLTDYETGSVRINSDANSRVLRGGSWWGSNLDARVSSRYGDAPSDRLNDYGFRIARSLSH